MTLRPLATFVAAALSLSASFHASAVCTAGQLDTTFGPAASNGFVQVSPWLTPALFEGMTVGSDNRIYVPGAVSVDTTAGFAYVGVMRMARGGAIDRTFGGVGTVVPGNQTSSPSQGIGLPAGVAVDATGNLLVVNSGSTGYAVSRFLPDGTPDVSYGTNGTVQLNLSNPFFFVAITTLADGSAIVGTSAQNPSMPSNGYQALFVKLTPAGALDASFGSGGLSYLLPSGLAPNAQVRMTDIGLLSTGDLVGIGRIRDPGAGSFFQGFAVKIHANGALDGTYGTGGFSIQSMGSSNDFTPRSMVVQPDDKVVSAGAVTPANTEGTGTTGTPTVVRYNLNGSLDATFGSGGISQFLAGPDVFIGHVTQQANGKILVDFSGSNAIARLTSTGQLDTAFGTGGTMSIVAAAPLGSGPVNPVNIKASGAKIFVTLSSALNSSATSPYATFVAAVDQGAGAGCR